MYLNTDFDRDATNSRFAFNIDASANSVTLMPTGPMPPKPAVAAHTPAGKASNIARPMNMFVIYRKEWHPKVAAENPGLHNNKICKSTPHVQHTALANKFCS